MPFQDLDKWISAYPLLADIIALKPVTWLNASRKKMAQIKSLPVNRHDMEDADTLWKRFAPYLEKAFPELAATKGIIESGLSPIEDMKNALNVASAPTIRGRLLLKRDDALPIVGSVKARGGIFEVLHYAEQLALESGLLQEDDNYAVLDEDRFKELFAQYSIGVGSTGNLGLSIGVISARLGFQVTVYMSADAKAWKKELLRSKGAHVREFAGDFGEAITEGRRTTLADPKGYFVDDENSKYLYLGYSIAAIRLKKQLEDMNITVDEAHPLFVYSPCGVGGSPGGIAFGLRQVFGDSAHCFFVEPTHSPSVLIGMMTGKMEKVSVQDFGIDNHTEADGLAVGRPSAFATAISRLLISGIYTVEDDSLFRLLYRLGSREHIFVEPSAAAGLAGPQQIIATDYLNEHHLCEEQVTHIAWATGGSLVPKHEMELFFERGKQLCNSKVSVQ